MKRTLFIASLAALSAVGLVAQQNSTVPQPKASALPAPGTATPNAGRNVPKPEGVAAGAASLVRRRAQAYVTSAPARIDDRPRLASALGQHDTPVEAHLTIHAVEGRLDAGRVSGAEAAERPVAAPR